MLAAPNRRRGLVVGVRDAGPVLTALFPRCAFSSPSPYYLDNLPPNYPIARGRHRDRQHGPALSGGRPCRRCSVTCLIGLIALLLSGPSRPAKALRSLVNRGLDACARGLAHAGSWVGAVGRSLGAGRPYILGASRVLAVVGLVLANRPSIPTVLWTTVAVLAPAAIVEVFVRAPRLRPPARPCLGRSRAERLCHASLTYPSTVAAVGALVAGHGAHDGARPLLTYYDDATGERTELSPATLGSLVARAATMLRRRVRADIRGSRGGAAAAALADRGCAAGRMVDGRRSVKPARAPQPEEDPRRAVRGAQPAGQPAGDDPAGAAPIRARPGTRPPPLAEVPEGYRDYARRGGPLNRKPRRPTAALRPAEPASPDGTSHAEWAGVAHGIAAAARPATR